MSICKAKTAEFVKKFGASEKDTGAPDVQCAILTERITNLTTHFKTHKKDFHSRRGLLMLIGQRKRLLSYIKTKDQARYASLIKELGIRK